LLPNSASQTACEKEPTARYCRERDGDLLGRRRQRGDTFEHAREALGGGGRCCGGAAHDVQFFFSRQFLRRERSGSRYAGWGWNYGN
jgi:hypothetical protein